MTTPVAADSLRAKFRALEEERRVTWAPEALTININQRALLVREQGTAAAARIVHEGDIIPAFTLPSVDGGTVSLDDLVRHGPAVLVFFRFAGCPACNLALSHYQKTLWPTLHAAGVPLVAISPQPEIALSEIVKRHSLPFPVLTDRGLALSRTLGITYTYDEASRQAAVTQGTSSATINGLDNVWELPKPTILIVGPGRRVYFADVSPDWMNRTESAHVLAALAAYRIEMPLAPLGS